MSETEGMMEAEAEIDWIQGEIDEINEMLQPHQRRLDKLKSEHKKLKSQEFIKVNNITRDDVEMSGGDDRPYFGHIKSFIDWLKSHSNKRFAEWNTIIYFQGDLKAGKMPMDSMPATIDDLPK